MNTFKEALYAELLMIPTGKLTTYGNLAKRIGYPKHARHVGSTLSKLPKDTKLPWYRVVNGQRKPSFPATSSGYARQVELLATEGVLLKGTTYPRDHFIETT